MKKLLIPVAIATGLCLGTALAQTAAPPNPTLSNVIPGSTQVSLQAKITAINPETRAVTLASATGNQVSVTAGPNVRLEMLKVGDTVNAQYYRSVAFEVVPPTPGNQAPVSNDWLQQIIAQGAQTPGGVGVRVTQIQATVVGIDLAANSIDVVNPSGGGVYTVRVTNPARIPMLSELKVGDTVSAVVSQAVAVSIEPAPRSWF
jgi:hypothetical protein